MRAVVTVDSGQVLRRVERGFISTAAALGGLALLALCALLAYRRHQKLQQTVFPAAGGPAEGEVAECADSDAESEDAGSDTDLSDYE